MSNNPPLPPPDMDDFEATMIREENPLAEQPRVLSAEERAQVHEYLDNKYGDPDPGQSENKRYAKPRRAKKIRSHIWNYIALGAWFAVAGFIGAFLGTVLANIL